MKYVHLSKRYISDYGIVRTLEELDKMFHDLQVKRPAIYTDFRGWIDSLVGMGLLFPF